MSALKRWAGGFRALLRRAGGAAGRFGRWLKDRFGGGEPALCQMAAVVAALVGGSGLAADYWPGGVGLAVMTAGCLAVLELALWLARSVLRRLLGHSLGWLMALGLLLGAVAVTVEAGAGEGWTFRVWSFAALVVAALAALTVSLWSLLGRRVVTGATLCGALLSLGLTALLGIFLFTDGFDDHYIQRLLALPQERTTAEPALEPSLKAGPWEVRILDYGPGGGLESGFVNLNPYMNRDTGDFTGAYVEEYLEYDLNRVPLTGRVWYPAEGKNCPLLVIAHGNHEITTPSYLGYAYLGEYLASHGYVVASVDQNACNMLSGENDGRAVLLLEHIGQLLDYGDREESPLYGVLDPENIAIAGHSRGGEMVATAYLFNGYDNYPENGTIRFDYHYKIRSLIAIAPTVNQYMPADHSVELEDVNYLLLHGAADRDVSNFMGMAQYENISFTGEKDCLKTALYIAGANHGQFNSLWGAYDQRGPFSTLLNVEGLLEEAEQQEIARLFVKVFLDVTLRGDRSCAGLLLDWDDYARQLPETVYYQCWESSGFRLIADFEEDSDLTTAALPGAALKAEGVNWWTEERMGFAGRSGEDTHALRLRWRGRGTYRISLPAMDFSGRALAFDLCDLDSDAVERGDLALLDGEVTLTDAGGRQASARLADFATVWPILSVRTDKLDFLFGTSVYHKAMTTVAIPTERFAAEEGFDAGQVTEILFTFDHSGQAALDNIGLEPVWGAERG